MIESLIMGTIIVFFTNLFLGIWLKIVTGIIGFIYRTIKEFLKIRKERNNE